MLGISSLAASTEACAYIGWYDYGWAGDWHYGGGLEGNNFGLIVDTWDQLASGTPPNAYPFWFVRNWMHDNRPYYEQPNPDGPTLSVRTDAAAVAAFFNWRFLGNAYVKLF